MILFSLMPVIQTATDGMYETCSHTPAAADLGAADADLSDSREVIVKKALRTIEQAYDMETYRFSLSPRWIPGSLQRVDGKQIRTVMPEGNIERYTNFTVSYIHRNQLKSAQVQLVVEAEQKLPVANRRIPAGEIIEKGDLDLRWVEVSPGRGQLVDSVAGLNGKTIRRTLVNGQPVRYADITSELLIEAGDVIRLIFEQNGVRIEMEAEARQSGAQDEKIIIYNKDTRKRYVGKVSGPGTALWIRTQ